MMLERGTTATRRSNFVLGIRDPKIVDIVLIGGLNGSTLSIGDMRLTRSFSAKTGLYAVNNFLRLRLNWTRSSKERKAPILWCMSSVSSVSFGRGRPRISRFLRSGGGDGVGRGPPTHTFV